LRLPSRASHDSLFIARISPMGMIFVPSKSGYGHRSDEYTSPEEIARGVKISRKRWQSFRCDDFLGIVRVP